MGIAPFDGFEVSPLQPLVTWQHTTTSFGTAGERLRGASLLRCRPESGWQNAAEYTNFIDA
jgi:hypothetical protein